MTKFVLNRLELTSKKDEAKRKIVSELGQWVTIKGDTIQVVYDMQATKVVKILNRLGVKYSGG